VVQQPTVEQRARLDRPPGLRIHDRELQSAEVGYQPDPLPPVRRVNRHLLRGLGVDELEPARRRHGDQVGGLLGGPRHTAVAAYLHERDGDLATAARLYAEAAHKAPDLAERDHLTRQAARLNTHRSH